MDTRRLVGALAIGLLVGVLLAPSPLGLAQATDWPSLIQAAKPAVVWIQVQTREGTSCGSGALISPDGYILTAAHVIEGATSIKVVVEDSREYGASVVNADYKADVAVLKIPASGLTWFALGDSDRVRIEEEIRVLGYPIPELGAGVIAVAGVIQGTRVRDGVKLLQHNAATAGGHSGGPVINAQGQVIGVHSARLREDLGYRFAVGVNEAHRLIPWADLSGGLLSVWLRPPVVIRPIRVPQDRATLAAALRAAPEGGEILLARGTHRSDVDITKSVTITGEPEAVVEGTVRVSAARAVTLANLEVHGAVEIRDTTSFTLDRVTVKRSPGDGVVIEASTGLITGCTVEDAQGSGIVASFGARVMITNTSVRRSAKAGISLLLDAQAWITRCSIVGNSEDGVFLASSAAEISDNWIVTNAGSGIAAGRGAFVTPSELLAQNTIKYNGRGATIGIGPARFWVTDLIVTPEPPVPINTYATVLATITNVGAEAATKAIWLSLTGAKAQEMNLSLEPGQSRGVEFAYQASVGEVVTICSDDACASDVTVQVYVGRFHHAHKVPLPEGSARRLGIGYITGEIALSEDMKLAVETSLGIELWDLATWELVHVFKGMGPLAFSPDGGILAASSSDHTIKLWNVATAQELRTLTGHTCLICSVGFSPDGKVLVSGSYDRTIKLWDVVTGTCIRTLTGHTETVKSVAFSPDGKTLVSGSYDRTIKLWDVVTGTCIRTLTGHTGLIYSVAFSPDGKTFASGSDDWTIKLWDVVTGTCIRTLTGYTGSVYSVAFSPDGSTLASGSSDSTIKFWDVRMGTELRTMTAHTVGGIKSVAFSPDGKILVSGSFFDRTIKLCDVAAQRELWALAGHTSPVESVALSPDGEIMATSGSRDTAIRLWDTETGASLRALTGHTNWVYSVAFSPDGKTLASGAGDKTIRLWNTETGACLRTLTGHTDTVKSVAFSSDGKTLASGSLDRTIKLWDVATGACLRTLSEHTHSVESVAFSPDRRTLASGSGDGTIKLWNVATGRCLRTLAEHTWAVVSLAFTPDGRILASGSYDCTIKLWDAASGACLRTFEGHTRGVNSVAFFPDGKTLASGSQDGTVLLWDVEAILGRR